MSGIYGWFLTNPMFAKDTILLGIGRYFYNKWTQAESKTLEEDIRLNAKQTWIQASMQWLSRIVSTGAYGAIVYLTATAKGAAGSIGSITNNIGLFRLAQGQVQGLSDLLVNLNNSITFLEDYFKLMEFKSAMTPSVPNVTLNGEGVRSIEFRNVSFAYPDAPKKALDNITFRLEAGESIFLAGRNGAGKTSMIKLLTRLYEPTEGTILINGRDIRNYEPAMLRKAFAVLLQDYAKYPFTARENIQVGDIDNADDTDRIEHAVDAAKFREILAKMPDGLDSYLMKMFWGGGHRRGSQSSGHDLSGGEWQKLALARSFFRRSSVFILDEPTSALDVQSEAEILGFFKDHVKDKIAIIVSHRLSAAAIADRVIFVEGGKIVEEGRHTELIQASGPYASLYNLQQSGFSFL
jgi:ATP-binding cassette subfamily B protein